MSAVALVVLAPGGELYTYEDPGFDFTPAHGAILAGGTVRDPPSGDSGDGRRPERVPSRRLFPFEWQDGHGEDSFVRPNDGVPGGQR